MSAEAAENKPKKNWKKEVFEWIYTIAIAIVVAVIIKSVFIEFVEVDGASMNPTLTDGDRLIMTKLGYEPERGDIIILDSHYKARESYCDSLAESEGKDELGSLRKLWIKYTGSESVKEKFFVKRVIALPGETVDIRDGKVYVNDVELDESYYDGLTYPTSDEVEFPQVVADDCVFVMGDNRPNSRDSRSPDLGQVPLESIQGKAQVRVLPISGFGYLYDSDEE